MRRSRIQKICRTTAVLTAAFPLSLLAQDAALEERLRALEAQNGALQEQLAAQQKILNQLKEQVAESSETSSERDEWLDAPRADGFRFGRVHLGGEGGLGFFHTGSDGQYPDSSFRVDEAKLFVETPVWEDTYFFGELDLVIREANDEFFHLGELYIDFEHVLRRWTEDNWLNLRVGRVDIPFGEEYLVRDVIDNPLISHSLSDLWGIDEGVELYGSLFGFDYVVAVQNGSHPTLEDFDSDKSVAGRLGYNFGNRARVSFSGMRTGDISVEGDELSELWFGHGFFRQVGSEETTTRFESTLYELDAQTFWRGGHLKGAIGYFQYDDDDTIADQARDGTYYYIEGVQDITSKLYGAARFSQIRVTDGLHLIGHGNGGRYFFRPNAPLTRDLWRLSLGLGYRWSDNLLTKVEYSFERGELVNGTDRDRHDFVGAELGFKF